MNIDVDVCDVLPLIRVPTLVMHRKEGEHGTSAVAATWPNTFQAPVSWSCPARTSPSLGDQETLFAELERFLADVVAGKHPETEPDRVLATVLFTDIVGADRACCRSRRPGLA